MIDNIHNSQITQAMGRNPVPHTDATNKTAADRLDGSPAGDVSPVGTPATLQADFADLINQAIQASQTEMDAVQRARALLESGQLTNLENIRSAAENIITFGI
jgi:hypothetical protein